MKSILSAWKNAAWQDKAFIGALILFSITYAILFSSFHQFPSEYYGGDHYAHFATVMKIYNTGNPFISAQYANEIQHYPWLSPFVIAFIARIFFVDPFILALFFPIFILIATMCVTYAFGKKYFESKTWALILTLFWIVQLVPSFHPSDTAKQLMIPLLALFVILLLQKMSTKQAIGAGLIYGIASLQHVVTFVVASVSMVLCGIFVLLQAKTREEGKEYLKKWSIVAGIGIFFALLFWLPLYLVYNGEAQNQWQLYSAASVYPSAELITGTLAEILWGSGVQTIASVLLLFCFLYYGMKKKDKKLFVPFFLFLAGLIGIIHPYITYPLFGISVGYYRFPIVFVFVAVCIFVTGLFYFWREICAPMFTEYTATRLQIVKKILLISTFLWIIFLFIILLLAYQKEERYAYAIENSIVIEGYHAVQKFIKNNAIPENEIFATTHPDVGFLFNGMTGKNVLLTRITHANPFVDHNKRAADMAIILYGNNRTKAEELITAYGVTYLFFEPASLNFKTLCLQKWEEVKITKNEDETTLAYWCLQTDPIYEEYLRENGIETQKAVVRLAAGDKDVPLIKVLAIKPEEIKLQTELAFAYTSPEDKLVVELYKVI